MNINFDSKINNISHIIKNYTYRIQGTVVELNSLKNYGIAVVKQFDNPKFLF